MRGLEVGAKVHVFTHTSKYHVLWPAIKEPCSHDRTIDTNAGGSKSDTDAGGSKSELCTAAWKLNLQHRSIGRGAKGAESVSSKSG